MFDPHDDLTAWATAHFEAFHPANSPIVWATFQKFSTNLCESVIESVALAAMMCAMPDAAVRRDGEPSAFPRIVPQAKVGRYRADFVVRFSPTHAVDVECDGAEFHAETDKRDADRARNKAFHKHGLVVMRFWSKQICGYPEGVGRAIAYVGTHPRMVA